MKNGWKPFYPKNNLMQDSEGNEENVVQREMKKM
jgi:hypothetical protein